MGIFLYQEDLNEFMKMHSSGARLDRFGGIWLGWELHTHQ